MLTQTQVNFENKIQNIITDVSDNCCENKDLPHIVYFSPGHEHSIPCEKSTIEMFGCTWSLPKTWRELGEELEKHGQYMSIDADFIGKTRYSSAAEFVEAIRTVAKLIPGAENLRIAVVITCFTSRSVVKEFQQAGVQGILFEANYFDNDQVRQGLNAFFNGIPYWPREILKNLPGAAVKKATAAVKLTPRQQQIFRMIKERGATNKTIARTLKISESTVKLHVTGIFKKYGVRNRTQLAVFTPPDPV